MTHPVAASFARRSSEVAEWLGKNPWVGWAAWIVFCISILVQTGPKRFGSTFSVYLDYASKLWNKQPLYDATTLDGFNYWPSSLLIYIPVLRLRSGRGRLDHDHVRHGRVHLGLREIARGVAAA